MNAGSADSAAQLYAQAQLQSYAVEDASIGVRVFGQGPAVVLIHGSPCMVIPGESFCQH